VRVLVTGATGYLGRAIVAALQQRGHTVIAFARRATPAGVGDERVDGDITDAAAVDRAAAGCDAVCHTAALVSVWTRDPSAFDRVNVEATRRVFDAVRRHHLRRCVYTSSFLALPPAGRSCTIAGNDYQRTKARALAVADEFVALGTPIITMIPGVIYGPGTRTEGNLVARLLTDRVRGRLPAIIGPDRTWSFAYIDEVAEAHAAAIDVPDPRPRYGLGGENLPQRAIFDWLTRTRQVPPPRSLPTSLARAAGWLEEQRARFTGAMPMLTRGAVEVFQHDWPIDSADAIRDLGYHITPLADGLDRTWPTLGLGA
jgi:farnesol dehydrogenase